MVNKYSIRIVNMFERLRGDKSLNRHGRGRTAKAVTALAMTLAACTGSNADHTAQQAKETAAQLQEINADVAEMALNHDFDVSHTAWESRQIVRIGAQALRIYREIGQPAVEAEAQALIHAAKNSHLLDGIVPQATEADGAAIGQDFTVRIPNDASHNFLVFGSVDSITKAHEAGFVHPITSTLPDLQGNTAESVTLLAPYKWGGFIYNLDMNHRIYQRQRAVCGNIIDIEIGERTRQELIGNMADDPAARSDALARLVTDIKAEVCDNLANATTIKAGEDAVREFGGAYHYYSMLTDDLHEEAQYNGESKPYFKLGPDLFEKIIA